MAIYLTIFSIAIIHLFFYDISYATPNPNKTNGHHQHSSSLPPIILIPGFMASKLYIDGKNSEELKEICGGEDEEYENKKVWATAEYIDPKLQKCRFAQLTLTNDGHKSIIKNHGLSVNALGEGKEFGDTSSVKCLFLDGKDEHGNDQCAQSIIDKNDEANFAPLIKWLTENLGYKEGKNLFAGPYDWRFETNNDYLNEYYEELTKLIEKAKKENGKKVLLILHSYGNSIGNYYLNHFKSEEKWQKDHIASTINVAAPFGGAVEVLEEIISGNSGRYFSSMAQFVSNSTVLPFIRSLGSTAAVLPNYWAFTNKQLVEIPFPKEKNGGDEKSWINWIFSIPTKNEIKMANHLNVRKNEKESNIDELLEKIEIPFFKEIYHKTIPKPQEHIKMHCIYGTDLPTPIKYVYGHAISKPPTETINGDGDNTINIESLRVCKEWKTHWKAPVGEIVELPKVTHAGILHNEQFYAFGICTMTGNCKPKIPKIFQPSILEIPGIYQFPISFLKLLYLICQKKYKVNLIH